MEAVAIIAALGIGAVLLMRPSGPLSGMSAKAAIQKIWDVRAKLAAAQDPTRYNACVMDAKEKAGHNAVGHAVLGSIGTATGAIFGTAGAGLGNRLGGMLAGFYDEDVPDCRKYIDEAKAAIARVQSEMRDLGIDPDSSVDDLETLMRKYGYPAIYDPAWRSVAFNQFKEEEAKRLASQAIKDGLISSGPKRPHI